MLKHMQAWQDIAHSEKMERIHEKKMYKKQQS